MAFLRKNPVQIHHHAEVLWEFYKYFYLNIGLYSVTKLAYFDLIVVGHLTYDLISSFNKETGKVLGGVVTYTAISASNLGAKVGIATKVGVDFRKKDLDCFKKANIDLSGLKIVNSKTTVFENIYDERGRRTQRLLCCADKIRVRDIPQKYLRSKCFHFGPVFHEVSYDIIKFAHDRGILTSLDAQGYCRRREADLSINLCNWERANEVLPHVDILKCDEDEAKMITNESDVNKAALLLNDFGSKIVLITRGEKGSILCYDKRIKGIPAVPPEKIVDLTGAGDTYIAGFIVEYLKTGNPEWSALFASGVASFTIEGIGISTIPTKEHVLMRLKRLNFS